MGAQDFCRFRRTASRQIQVSAAAFAVAFSFIPFVHAEEKAKDIPKKPAGVTANTIKASGNTTASTTISKSAPKKSVTITKASAASTKTGSATSKQSTLPTKQSTAKLKANTSQKAAAGQTVKPTASHAVKGYTRTTGKRPVRRITRPPIPAIPAVVTAQGKPIWLNVDDGLKAGKALKKYVVADFYTDWCGWCKVLDKTTFHDPTVESFLAKNAICMKVNSEDNKTGSSLSEKFEVSGWPTVIIFDPAGHEVDRNAGYLPAAQFLEWARKTIPPKK